MPCWSGHAEVRLAGGNHQDLVSVSALTPAQAMAAGTQEAVDSARQALRLAAPLDDVIEIALSLTRDDA